MGGLSLGGQVLVEALSQRGAICAYAVIESALVVPLPLTEALIAPTFGASYGLIKKKWFSEMQFKSLGIQAKLFDDYYRDTCEIQKKDMIRFLKSSSSYVIKPGLSGAAAKTTILVGGKERKAMLRSAEILHVKDNRTSCAVKAHTEGSTHGDAIRWGRISRQGRGSNVRHSTKKRTQRPPKKGIAFESW